MSLTDDKVPCRTAGPVAFPQLQSRPLWLFGRRRTVGRPPS